MAERKTLAQLRAYRARQRMSINVAVAGVVHGVDKLEESFKGRAGANPNAVGKTRRAIWLVDNSSTGEVTAAKAHLWGPYATQLGAWLQQEVEAGRAPVLSIDNIYIDYIERGQLGCSNKGPEGDTAFQVHPSPPEGVASIGVEPLQDRQLAEGLQAWYAGEGVGAAADQAVAAAKRLIRDKGNVGTTNPDKQATFATAAIGRGGEAAPPGKSKKRGAQPAEAQAQKKKKTRAK